VGRERSEGEGDWKREERRRGKETGNGERTYVEEIGKVAYGQCPQNK